MNIFEFLTTASNQEQFTQQRVYVLVHPTYPPLLSAKVLEVVRAHHEVQVLDLENSEPSAVHAQLSTSFLGQALVFWLGFLGDLDAKQKKWAMGLLSTYQGPHQLIAMVDEAPKKLVAGVSITLPDVIEQGTYEKLAQLFGIPQKVRCPIERPLLETACLLLSYQRLLGSRPAPQFAEYWLPKLVTPEQSLFALAQSFFSKQPKTFFQKWTGVMAEYAEPFWISFWADQLWRAYWFVYYTELGNHAEAKRAGARLPFSFLQRDWKQHTLESLREAHDALYAIDFHVKNGASGTRFDLFFSNFFHTSNV